VQRLFGNHDPRPESQDAPASDQWAMPEMWIPAGVGVGSEQNVNATKPTSFPTVSLSHR
jgi:hypothetical protein